MNKSKPDIPVIIVSGNQAMTNVVETHVSRLRAKVDKPFATELIKTVRGAGYRFSAKV